MRTITMRAKAMKLALAVVTSALLLLPVQSGLQTSLSMVPLRLSKVIH